MVEDGILLPTYPNYCALTGDYLTVNILEWQDKFFVCVRDCDDGLIRKTLNTRQEAEQEIQNLIALSPFIMSDLVDFDYLS